MGANKMGVLSRIKNLRKKRSSTSSRGGSNPSDAINSDILQTTSPIKNNASSETEDDSVGTPQILEQSPPVPYVTREGDHVITTADSDLYRPSMVREVEFDNFIGSTSISPLRRGAGDSVYSESINSRGRSLSSNTRGQPVSYASTSIDSRSYSRDTFSQSTATSRRREKCRRTTVILKDAPPAKEAAFDGPPRYDWIDVETAAALKVQSYYRRNKVLRELEEKGMLTSAMRNRLRKKRSTGRQLKKMSDDSPLLFTCCDLGFLFGDASLYDPYQEEQEMKKMRQQVKLEQSINEEKLRKFRMRKKESESMLESIEVVEDV